MIRTASNAALTRVNPDALASARVLADFAGVPLPRWAEFAEHIQCCDVAAGDTVFMQGVLHPFAYAVRRGLIKNVYLREDGEAWVKSFTPERQIFASVAALQPSGLTSFSAVAVEDCELERLPFDLVQSFARTDLAWATMLQRATLWFATRKEKRERDLLLLTPEARYRQLAEEHGDLERRLTQKDIAAYIGVTPVGLNRIIRRVRAD